METAAGISANEGTSLPLRLDMRNISKHFGAVTVLDDISLTCRAGEVLAICGENGAGKSTLMKVLAGFYRPDAGDVHIDGNLVHFRHPLDSQREGVAIIHQELSLLPHRTVAQNIFLGREPTRFGIVDHKRMRVAALRVLARLQSTIDPNTLAGMLPIADQQVVEIAKALTLDARILVFDEPTAALDNAEAAKLFRLIEELRRDGASILYISHRMGEVFTLADRICVIKDGRLVGDLERSDTNSDAIVRLMVGREIGALFPPRSRVASGEEVLSIADGGNRHLHDIALTLRAGEITGVAGLEGSGKTALARAITGDEPFKAGNIRFWDGKGAASSPREGVRRKIAYVPDDRKSEGLGLRQSLRENAALTRRALSPSLSLVSRGGCSAPALDALLRQLDVRAANHTMPVGALSGGNQQKVVVARWLAVNPRLWVLCEPTRGVDVGAKSSIYSILRSFADVGGSVLVVSSDLAEVIGLSDRILVMGEGRIAAECPAGASEEDIMKHAVLSHRPLSGAPGATT
ncbi:sugar ABC transporter ATP-binding protein [Rhizobium sp. P44RR-XXIV]|uniref:sugar ABC transporter ATP-binding protein n=1 Tax=Rhizobium sp. P44RR-XXIV TaxID=1921145 RepID=UPI000987245C|nr:sugar ABC transporter ATP-binding protein [Rhizobium sp. P44RR-XXIV]TIX87569.1 sugar ABC transporter ATP-binding protein [Rhizobium sp. P44RR-XXIV]